MNPLSMALSGVRVPDGLVSVQVHEASADSHVVTTSLHMKQRAFTHETLTFGLFQTVGTSMGTLPPVGGVEPKASNKWVDAYERGRTQMIEDLHFMRKYKVSRAEWQEAEKSRAAAEEAVTRSRELEAKREAFDLAPRWIEPVVHPAYKWST